MQEEIGISGIGLSYGLRITQGYVEVRLENNMVQNLFLRHFFSNEFYIKFL